MAIRAAIARIPRNSPTDFPGKAYRLAAIVSARTAHYHEPVDQTRLSNPVKEERMLSPGDKAPDFVGRDHNGNTVKLSDFKGKRVVLWFFPKADTPG